MANKWDEKYAGEGFLYGTEANDFLREAAGRLPPRGEVLSLGEGEGRNAAFLAERGHRVTALDQSSVGLAKVAALAASRGLTIATVCADLAHYAFEPGRWDGIVSIWCHLPTELRCEVHGQVVRSLRPGGVFLLEAYTTEQLRFRTGGPTSPDLLPSLAELREELAGLDFLAAREIERVVREGTGHHGLSAVVQIVARRPG